MGQPDKRTEVPRAAEQRVADFMAAHGRDILDMPLSRISAACGVSDATVVRYCLHAGYKGLKDFKISMSRIWSEADGAPTVRGDEQLPELQRRVFAGCMDALRSTAHRIDAAELSRALNAIADSDNLDVYACGGSLPIASYLRHQLVKLGIRTAVYSDRTSMLLSQSRLNSRDTVLSISSSGQTQDVNDAQASARKAGARTVCITAHPESALAAASDIVLVAAGEQFLGNNTYSRLSQLAVVDLLYAGLAVMRMQSKEQRGDRPL
ncbi:MAG: MurR/RpiR family transcriptional regulator [Clostridia bacterium]|nr:MurR/RpiR family transcriptional regulator [Clostridia bacterium]